MSHDTKRRRLLPGRKQTWGYSFEEVTVLTTQQHAFTDGDEEGFSWAISHNIVEIDSGSIIPAGREDSGKLKFIINTNTQGGQKKFLGIQIPSEGGRYTWGTTAVATQYYLSFPGNESPDPAKTSKTDDSGASTPSPSSILDVLRLSTDSSAVTTAILSVEITAFSLSEAQEVLPLVHRFILGHRMSTDVKVALSAAAGVRAYVALLPVDRLDESADLFDGPGLPEPFESELAKMITRKLTANPPAQDDHYPAIAERLARLADAYLHPHLLPKPYCGAIALNSVLAIALMRTSRWSGVLSKVERLTANWFRQQLGRRAGKLADELGTTFPAGRTDAQQASLRQLSELGLHAVT